MAKYLISVTENYRVDTEGEAIKLIDEARQDGRFALKKHGAVHKERKQKGEIIDSYYMVSLTKSFDDEKEPGGSTTIEYDTDGSAF